MRHILVRGESVACDAEVKLRAETGLTFPFRGKRTETRAVVWHHTAGEGGGERVHSTLVGRGLSVHFLIDQVGVIWQYVDADAYCSHAKGANGWTCGVEIANRADNKAAHQRWPREVAQDRVHDRKVVATQFLPAQVASALALADALSRAYGLPKCVPVETDGAVIAGELSTAARSAFRGHLGHYHLDQQKWDPGTRLMKAFAEAWSKP